MKSFKKFAIAGAFAVFAAHAGAQTVSATATTLDDAEAKIAAKAQAQSASYKIVSAIDKNRVHVTAELLK